jgi:hypothetical protein
MRPDARAFRERLAAVGIALQPTTCDALVTGSDVCDGAKRPYIVELDVRLAGAPPAASSPTYVAPLRLPSAPVVTRNREGDYTIRVPHLSLSALEHCAVGRRLQLWTREDVDMLHLLEPTSVAGSGRIVVLNKADVPELAADPERAVAIARQIGVRSCVIDCSVPVAKSASVESAQAHGTDMATSDEGAALA